MSDGRVFSGLAATLVKVTTDEGLHGWGEQTPFPGYMAAHAGGARANIAALSTGIIGADPTNVTSVQQMMRRSLKGHHAARSALDMACWDIKGKQAGQSVSQLLGGVTQASFPVLRAIGVTTPVESAIRLNELADEGATFIQVKLEGDPEHDVARVNACLDAVPDQVSLSFDANGGFRQDQAVSFAAGIGFTRHYVEQPCDSLDACLSVRDRTGCNLILDESLVTLSKSIPLLSTHRPDGAMLKLSRFGGITPTITVSRVCEALGIPFIVEDGGAGDIIAAASAQVTAASDPRYLLSGSLTNVLIQTRMASNAPRYAAGRASLPQGDGLALGEVDESALGAPEITIT